MPHARGNAGLDVAVLEAELTRVWALWERALEELGGAIPSCQLRAMLLIEDAGVLPLTRLAMALGLSISRTSNLCDRLETAGLLTSGLGLAAGSPPGITLAATTAGRRLAAWIRDQRRTVLAQELESLSADSRRALARTLRELAARRLPPQPGGPPETNM
jgi:DNA-binding MarR family transcriptional regulator